MTESWDREAFENALVADMRANGGTVTSGPMAGQPLLVMFSTGATSGEERRAILTHSMDGDAYVVAGSAAGSPKDPAWLRNLRANPNVRVEAGGRTFDAVASIADEPDRTRLWDQHVALLPAFADYPAQSGRTIPMVTLTAKSA